MGFAENLKLLRKYRNLTQAQLAERANISTSSVINYENRRRKDPPVSVMESLAAALDVPVETLMVSKLSTQNGVLHADMHDKYGFPEWGFIIGKDGPPSDEEIESHLVATERGMILHSIMKRLECLNMSGLEEALKRIHEMTEIQRYKLSEEELNACRANEPQMDLVHSRDFALTDDGKLNTAPEGIPEQES